MKTFDPSQIARNIGEIKEEAYIPKHTFNDFVILPIIKTNIVKRGFTAPTPIQDAAIPLVLEGKDVVGIANTGTGKTAAFLVPLLNKVLEGKNRRILIIVPTRELAVQIENELRLLSGGLGIFSVVCIGGVSMSAQINKLKQSPQFVIGTPGRLLDLNKQGKINFRTFGSVVLDEVDRMLDMGFIKDIQKIIFQLPGERQSLFFSATLGENVLGIMRQFTRNPVTVSVKSHDIRGNVNQEIIRTNGKGKLEVLESLLRKQEFEKVLIFGRTKRGAEKLFKVLSAKGHRVSAIHGNKRQNQRQKSLDLFKEGHVNILIATDVVARGIDVDNITHVINYELPETYDAYLHRIGRTARMGKKGTAITLID